MIETIVGGLVAVVVFEVLLAMSIGIPYLMYLIYTGKF